MEKEYLTVSQLTHYVSLKFDRDPYLQTVYLTGELSNFNPKGNNHKYFTLKDEKTQIQAVMFKRDFDRVAFQPKDGDEILVTGRVQVYEPHGKYQIRVTSMEPSGLGQLFLRLEELKKRLGEEGLFDLPKKPIPKFPKKIAIVTSATGAVIRDIIRNVRQRYPIVQLVLYPTTVQGQAAAAEISRNIKRADQTGDFDTIIVGRGGGSFEDLFCFNEEAVVRAVAEAQTPIISSVGHETDKTLVDYVADYSASTPTEAAVHATPVLVDLIQGLDQVSLRISQAFSNRLAHYQKRLDHSQGSYVFQQPHRLYEAQSQRLDLLDQSLKNIGQRQLQLKKQAYLNAHHQLKNNTPVHRVNQGKETLTYTNQRFKQAMERYLKDTHTTLNRQIEALDLLSPLQILSRGYSYTMKDQAVLKSVDQVQVDDKLTIRLADGEIQAQVQKIEKEEENGRK